MAAPAAPGKSREKLTARRSVVKKSGKVVDPYDPFFAEDAHLVGSSSLISSPNTIEPTDAAFRKPPPMPSVHTDGRGEVFNLLIGAYHADTRKGKGASGESSDQGSSSAPSSERPPGTRRINLSHTKKGVMRHGDFHPNTQCSFLFSGSIEVWQPTPGGTTLKTVYGPKDYIEIPPYVPHVYNFLEDTIMAEWWESSDGAPSHFKHWFYAPYRRIVDVSFVRTTAGEKGKLAVFREVGKPIGDGELGLVWTPPSKTNWTAWLGAGVVVAALGFTLGVSVGRGQKG